MGMTLARAGALMGGAGGEDTRGPVPTCGTLSSISHAMSWVHVFLSCDIDKDLDEWMCSYFDR